MTHFIPPDLDSSLFVVCFRNILWSWWQLWWCVANFCLIHSGLNTHSHLSIILYHHLFQSHNWQSDLLYFVNNTLLQLFCSIIFLWWSLINNSFFILYFEFWPWVLNIENVELWNWKTFVLTYVIIVIL